MSVPKMSVLCFFVLKMNLGLNRRGRRDPTLPTLVSRRVPIGGRTPNFNKYLKKHLNGLNDQVHGLNWSSGRRNSNAPTLVSNGGRHASFWSLQG